jgi:hypothetical protein
MRSTRRDSSYGFVDTLNQPFRSVCDAETGSENSLSI